MTIRNPNPVMNLFVIDGITSSQLGKAQKPNAHFADIALSKACNWMRGAAQ